MATTKAQSLPGGILKLTKLLDHLNKPPKLTLVKNVKTLRLTVAHQNDHWGARHFIQEDLPRIRYANPDLEIKVVKWRKEKNEHWRPELELKFDDGRHQTLDMHQKWSATILKELMSVAGGDPWKVHVAEAKRTGMPILPGEEIHEKAARAMTMKGGEKNEKLPNLKEYLKANPHRAQREKTEGKTGQQNNGEGELKIEEAKVEQVIGEQGSTSIPPPLSSATPSS